MWVPLEQERLSLSSDGLTVAVAVRRRRDAVEGSASGDPRTAEVSIGRHRGGRIWVGDAASAGRATAALVSPEGWSAWGPSWAEDSSTLAFVAAGVDGKPRLWRWSRSTGAALIGEWILRVGLFPDDTPRWSPDGGVLYVITADVSTADLAVVTPQSKTVRTAVSPPSPGQAGILSPWLAAGGRVVAVDASTGAATATWTIPAAACFPSPDGEWLAIVGPTRQPSFGSHVSTFDLWVVPSSGGGPVVGLEGLAADMNAAVAEPVWSPTASALAIIVGSEIAILVPGNSTRRFAGPVGLVPSLLAWFGDGRRLLVRGRDGLVALDTTTEYVALGRLGDDRTLPIPLRSTRTRMVAGDGEIVVSCSRRDDLCGEVWALPVTGAPGRLLYETDTEVNLGAPSVMGDDHGDVSADGEVIVFATQSPARPWRWWTTNPRFDQVRPIHDPNQDMAIQSFDFKTIDWAAPNGEVGRALVLTPTDHDGPMATVVEIYPGQDPIQRPPRFGDGSIVPYALLVAAGYAVLLPHMPTPSGPMPSLPPAGLTATIAAAVDGAVSAGIADPHRLAIAGHSAGAWAVNLLVTETERFSAAISAGGISDLAAYHAHFAFRDDGTWLTYGMAIAEHIGGGPRGSRPRPIGSCRPSMPPTGSIPPCSCCTVWTIPLRHGLSRQDSLHASPVSGEPQNSRSTSTSPTSQAGSDWPIKMTLHSESSPSSTDTSRIESDGQTKFPEGRAASSFDAPAMASLPRQGARRPARRSDPSHLSQHRRTQPGRPEGPA